MAMPCHSGHTIRLVTREQSRLPRVRPGVTSLTAVNRVRPVMAPGPKVEAHGAEPRAAVWSDGFSCAGARAARVTPTRPRVANNLPARVSDVGLRRVYDPLPYLSRTRPCVAHTLFAPHGTRPLLLALCPHLSRETADLAMCRR